MSRIDLRRLPVAARLCRASVLNAESGGGRASGAAQRCPLTMDGQAAAAITIARKRAVFYGVLNYAVELDIPAHQPDHQGHLEGARGRRGNRPARGRQSLQVRQCLVAVTRIGPDLAAFFGCLYYATMPPGEAVLLR